MNDFVSRLQSVLKEKNMTQGEMCEKLGIRRENFTYWKKNNILPGGDLLFKIADFLNVDVHWLARGYYSEFGISEKDQKHLNVYKQLPEENQLMIDMLMDVMIKKINGEIPDDMDIDEEALPES